MLPPSTASSSGTAASTPVEILNMTFKARATKVFAEGHREYNPGWHTCIDLRNLLLVAEAVTQAAIARKESRGAQFRDDFPTKSDEFSKFNHVQRLAPDGAMQLSRQPVKPIPDDLKQIIEENK